MVKKRRLAREAGQQQWIREEMRREEAERARAAEEKHRANLLNQAAMWQPCMPLGASFETYKANLRSKCFLPSMQRKYVFAKPVFHTESWMRIPINSDRHSENSRTLIRALHFCPLILLAASHPPDYPSMKRWNDLLELPQVTLAGRKYRHCPPSPTPRANPG